MRARPHASPTPSRAFRLGGRQQRRRGAHGPRRGAHPDGQRRGGVLAPVGGRGSRPWRQPPAGAARAARPRPGIRAGPRRRRRRPGGPGSSSTATRWPVLALAG
jgi:hypothetical protein